MNRGGPVRLVSGSYRENSSPCTGVHSRGQPTTRVSPWPAREGRHWYDGVRSKKQTKKKKKNKRKKKTRKKKTNAGVTSDGQRRQPDSWFVRGSGVQGRSAITYSVVTNLGRAVRGGNRFPSQSRDSVVMSLVDRLGNCRPYSQRCPAAGRFPGCLDPPPTGDIRSRSAVPALLAGQSLAGSAYDSGGATVKHYATVAESR